MIEIKRVKWEESESDLLAVRKAVFVEEQGVPEEIEVDEYDAVSRHFLARNPDGDAVGTARLLPNGKVGRVAVLKTYRGLGIGTALMRQVIQTWKTHRAESSLDPPSTLHLHAQSSSIGFYESFGFVAKGPEFEEAGIPHRSMAFQEKIEKK
ncbi:MAG: GNAT family N-acetyltransferase [Verrucomicrobiales bacterium]|nr:GNAT family N-acetyltransferase [Verrucomicrobiales bacterium]